MRESNGSGVDLNLNCQQLQDLIGLIVHSYNNHLTGILGHAEIAQLEPCDAEHGKALVRILSAGDDAVQLGKELLAALGRGLISLERISVYRLLERVSDSLLSKNIGVKLEKAEDFVIETEPSTFVAAIVDLVEFIESFKPTNGGSSTTPIVIKLSSDRTLFIAARFIDLKDEEQQLLFSPFYSSRVLTSGKQLGLATVKGFFSQTKVAIAWHNRKGFLIQL